MRRWLTYLAYNVVKLSPFVPLWLRRRYYFFLLDAEWDRLVRASRRSR